MHKYLNDKNQKQDKIQESECEICLYFILG